MDFGGGAGGPSGKPDDSEIMQQARCGDVVTVGKARVSGMAWTRHSSSIEASSCRWSRELSARTPLAWQENRQLASIQSSSRRSYARRSSRSCSSPTCRSSTQCVLHAELAWQKPLRHNDLPMPPRIAICVCCTSCLRPCSDAAIMNVPSRIPCLSLSITHPAKNALTSQHAFCRLCGTSASRSA